MKNEKDIEEYLKIFCGNPDSETVITYLDKTLQGFITEFGEFYADYRSEIESCILHLEQIHLSKDSSSCLKELESITNDFKITILDKIDSDIFKQVISVLYLNRPYPLFAEFSKSLPECAENMSENLHFSLKIFSVSLLINCLIDNNISDIYKNKLKNLLNAHKNKFKKELILWNFENDDKECLNFFKTCNFLLLIAES